MSEIEKTPIEDRIYIGNVDFKANEDDLKQFFEGLTVTDVDIPSKTLKLGKKTIEKHLGFAFIQFKDKEEADKAIEQFNGKEFKNRKIYVKKAVPPPTEEEKAKKNELFKAKKAEQAEKAKLRAKAKLEAKKEKKEVKETKEPKAKEPKAKEKEPKEKQPKELKEPKVKEPKEPKEKETAKETESKDESKEDKIPDGKPSDDTIFITNLDYKVNYKVLNTLFKELKPKWIHVPTRQVSPFVLKRNKAMGRPIFNKGIAFVKFTDKENQLKAVEQFNGKEINGREIIVDIAVDARIPKD